MRIIGRQTTLRGIGKRGKYWIILRHCQSTCAHDLDYFRIEDAVELCKQSQTRIIMEMQWRKRRGKWRKCWVLFGFVVCVTDCRIEPSCDGDSFNSFNSSDYETACLWRQPQASSQSHLVFLKVLLETIEKARQRARSKRIRRRITNSRHTLSINSQTHTLQHAHSHTL